MDLVDVSGQNHLQAYCLWYNKKIIMNVSSDSLEKRIAALFYSKNLIDLQMQHSHTPKIQTGTAFSILKLHIKKNHWQRINQFCLRIRKDSSTIWEHFATQIRHLKYMGGWNMWSRHISIFTCWIKLCRNYLKI